MANDNPQWLIAQYDCHGCTAKCSVVCRMWRKGKRDLEEFGMTSCAYSSTNKSAKWELVGYFKDEE